MPEFLNRANTTLKNILITEEMVVKLIENLQPNKSFGPDEIHPALLKELVNHVSGPITLIFKKSLEEGVVPKDWKMAHITAVYKKLDRSKAENYRPISLTSVVCKMLESLVKSAVMQHLSIENLLSTKQYGFVKGRSTITQLGRYFALSDQY